MIADAQAGSVPAADDGTLDVHHTTCCIVGGGPGGAVLALLLARRGVPVTLLEAHKDFDRALQRRSAFRASSGSCSVFPPCAICRRASLPSASSGSACWRIDYLLGKRLRAV